MNELLEAVFAELGFRPRSRERADVHVGKWAHPANADLFVVAGFDPRSGSGCMQCLARKLEYLWQRTTSIDDAMSLAGCTDAVRAAASAGVSLALTNAAIGQNWSLIAPWPDCAHCRTRRVDTGPWMPSLQDESVTRANVGATAGSQSGIDRSTSAESFLAENRGWFGFASALLNPTSSGDPGVSTVDAGMFLDAEEGVAPVGGKGLDRAQALASCVGEGIERFAIAGGFRVGDLAGEVVPASEAVAGKPWDHAIDFDGRDLTLPADARVEMIRVDSMDGRESRAFPASLVFAPYEPPPGCVAATPSSTSGAAVGKTVRDATLQATLELIERDAFWHYSRTGRAATGISVEGNQLVEEIVSAMGVSVTAVLLENPFEVPVVHVTFARRRRGRARTARGMGVSSSVELALRRALTEAVQMLRSLDTGIEVDVSSTDMRACWYSGDALDVFPQFFEPRPGKTISWCDGYGDVLDAGARADLLDVVVERATSANVRLHRLVLVETDRFAAVRCLSDRLLPLDDIYFPELHRNADWGDGPLRNDAYAGPLFM